MLQVVLLLTHCDAELVYAVLHAVLTPEKGEKKRDKEWRQKETEIREGGGRFDRGRGEASKGTARETEAEVAMLQCSGCFPRAVLLLVNKQNTSLSYI